MYPNVIIAGTNKAGTTSLFRYLADHPEVCASRIKEVRYFSQRPDPLAPEALSQYEAYFSACRDERVRLEASPNYLAGGSDIAGKIYQLLPDVRLIFVLREPVERLVSSFRRGKSRRVPAFEGMDLQEYLDALGGAVPGSEHAIALNEVNYEPLLSDFLAVFPSQQIQVCFFDELKIDSRALVKNICAFLNLEPDFYDNYNFQVENRTRNVRFAGLQRLAYRANLLAEPLFNRLPALRDGVRTVYYRINEDRATQSGNGLVDDAALRERLAPDMNKLSILLESTFPDIELPDWLELEQPTNMNTEVLVEPN